MNGLIKSGNGDPSHVGGDIDVYEVVTDDGSANLSYEAPFAEPPALIVSGESGGAGWSARGAKSATITGEDGDTVFVVAIGDR